MYLFKTNYGTDLIMKVREAAKRLSLRRREQQGDIDRLRENGALGNNNIHFIVIIIIYMIYTILCNREWVT